MTTAVLHIGAEWFTERPGGLDRYLADLLAAMGELAAPGDQQVPARAVVLGPAASALPTVTTAGSRGQSLPRRLLTVRRRAAQVGHDADVVDVHFALYRLLPVPTTRLRKVPPVVHFQGPWAEESALARGQHPCVLAAKRALERNVYRRARAVMVLSEAFGRIGVARYGVDPSRVHVIPPGVDLARFTLGDRAAARSRFDVADDAFLVVAARRLDPRMGLDALLDVWTTMQAVQPHAQLLIAGDGAEREQLARQIAGLADPRRVYLLGRVSDDDLVALHQAADCSVVPTRALEGFGPVTLEGPGLRHCGHRHRRRGPARRGEWPGSLARRAYCRPKRPGRPAARRRRSPARPGCLPGLRRAVRLGPRRPRACLAVRRGHPAAADPRRLPDHTAVLSGGELAIASRAQRWPRWVRCTARRRGGPPALGRPAAR